MKGQQARDRCGQSHGAAAEPGIRLDLNMYIHCNDDGGRRSRLANLVSRVLYSDSKTLNSHLGSPNGLRRLCNSRGSDCRCKCRSGCKIASRKARASM